MRSPFEQSSDVAERSIGRCRDDLASYDIGDRALARLHVFGIERPPSSQQLQPPQAAPLSARFDAPQQIAFADRRRSFPKSPWRHSLPAAPISMRMSRINPVAIRANPRILEPTVISPFLDWLNLQAGTTDGRYAFDFWARSVGRDNQSYNLDAAAIGYHYLSVGWDQTPHLISTMDFPLLKLPRASSAARARPSLPSPTRCRRPCFRGDGILVLVVEPGIDERRRAVHLGSRDIGIPVGDRSQACPGAEVHAGEAKRGRDERSRLLPVAENVWLDARQRTCRTRSDEFSFSVIKSTSP